jgi:hypothetical protein
MRTMSLIYLVGGLLLKAGCGVPFIDFVVLCEQPVPAGVCFFSQRARLMVKGLKDTAHAASLCFCKSKLPFYCSVALSALIIINVHVCHSAVAPCPLVALRILISPIFYSE